MEDSELKWEDQARGGEDSRKGMLQKVQYL